ncbi:hypothetical protein Nepgr_025725 [Nepenthes gracilis]|uniref:Uncharacterized protein n=1 Tax=Nepenthes gracilis TaxID=150966 RepID=A0AAD3T8B7_NEPGR|nr:hypothetical protein Nepgr_025725 [Nepenthes gracilis]
MTAIAASSLAAGLSPVTCCDVRKNNTRVNHKGSTPMSGFPPSKKEASVLVPVPTATNGRFERKYEAPSKASSGLEESKRVKLEEDDNLGDRLEDYFEKAAVFIRSDGGPPRWFSPLECGRSRLNNSPLLLYLPGIDGIGLGLIRQHQRLGRIFDVWCLHIPVMDRTPFTDLVNLVESTVRSEYNRLPRRPIYLVGESVGGCLALVVAARNSDIDLVLVLANPATSFSRSQLQVWTPLLEFMPSQPFLNIFNLLSSVVANVQPGDTLMWKMKMLRSSSVYANSRLHAVKAQTLILSSGRDPLLPSHEEGERLRHLLPNCEIRKFNNNGHFLFLEDGVDLVYTIKCTSFYRRGKQHDFVSDYIAPTPTDFKRAFEENRWIDIATCPVMLSTLANAKIVRGLAGIPSEGPVLFVGYHMLLGLELAPLVCQIFTEKNIVIRGMAHPLMFTKQKGGRLPDISSYDTSRLMGAVPVSGVNLFKLLSSKSHVLLYPGGVREALHRKGEEYKLFWPEQSEFVRMAARFGAKIIPFGVVGEDDIGQIVVDYDDLMRIPYFKSQIEELTNEAAKLRTDIRGEVSNQDIHLPLILPKVPGRLYYLFGKPIETEGRREELKDKQKAHALYLHVKSEVDRCLAYLKEKREKDPYRSLLPRTLYQAAHNFTTDVPTFEL